MSIEDLVNKQSGVIVGEYIRSQLTACSYVDVFSGITIGIITKITVYSFPYHHTCVSNSYNPEPVWYPCYYTRLHEGQLRLSVNNNNTSYERMGYNFYLPQSLLFACTS